VTGLSEGRESVTDEEISEQPATSKTEENIAKVRQIVCKNRQLTVRSTEDKRTSTEKQENFNSRS
jgi:hypothetical protein